MKKELIELIPTLPLIENVEDITESTRVAQDLKLSAGYARKFLYDYGDQFNVDISRFRFKKYFPVDIPALRIIRRFFGKNQALTLGEMEQAIACGRLNDEVLEKIRAHTGEKKTAKKLYFRDQAHYTFDQLLVYVLTGIALFIILSIVSFLFRD